MAGNQARYNISLWRGNSETIEFRFLDSSGAPDPVAVSGSTFIFIIVDQRGVEIINKTATPVGAVVSISMSPTETRMVPVGALCQYELERRIGTEQETWLYGQVIGMGGANDD